MKLTLFYILGMAIVYSLVCGLAWCWVLGLQFDWWKAPIVGAINAVLNIFVSNLGRKAFGIRESGT